VFAFLGRVEECDICGLTRKFAFRKPFDWGKLLSPGLAENLFRDSFLLETEAGYSFQ
jgi:hypothetical protein